jgi:tRNA (cytidine/uridine-2'-O-)-methyltransferase
MKNKKLHVILVNPEIPPNTGNIARMCGATGSDLHLVHPLGFKTDSKALRRAGLDYWSEVSVSHHESYEEAINNSGEGPIIVFSTHATRSYTAAPYAPGARLVFGAETRGLSREIMEENKNNLYRIPIWGKIRSLNLSTAAGIAVYEGYRQLGMLNEGVDENLTPAAISDLTDFEEFVPSSSLPGRLFVRHEGRNKKHPCKDCFDCQWCSPGRCSVCRAK